jgi:organic radical activating enzyme|tara:strand:- start:26 stop:1375 length:1350 start_codon:yes stop_codon:yes gene_type:complete
MSNKPISETFCPLPFNHIYIKPNNTASICCGFDASDVPLQDIRTYPTLADHLNTDLLQDIQQKMLKGEKVKGCGTCYHAEEHGYKSMRQKELDAWMPRDGNRGVEFTQVDTEDKKLQFIEITFGNYCNLACRTCGSDLSHSWADDTIRLQMANKIEFTHQATKRIDIKREWSDADFKDIERIKITGGEPMLHPDFYKFLSNMGEDSVECFIFTNASFVPKKKLLNALLKFKKIQVFLSIDATNEQQEYVRHNSTWKTTEESARTWLQWMKDNSDTASVSWGPTWSILNAPYFREICNWWLSLKNEILQDDKLCQQSGLVESNFLFYPTYYQMALSPDSATYVAEARAYLNELQNSKLYGKMNLVTMVEGYIQCYENSTDMTPEFRKKFLDKLVDITTTLDGYRNQSIEESLPLVYNSLKSYFNKDNVRAVTDKPRGLVTRYINGSNTRT